MHGNVDDDALVGGPGQLWKEDKVRRGGNRQELGNPLNQSENQKVN
jgi:hypothetical protein